jgi:integrase
MRERLRYTHISLSTEKAYLYWVRWFIRFHGLHHMEGLSGRVKDVAYNHEVIFVRDDKGGKVRVVMLPHSLQTAL